LALRFTNFLRLKLVLVLKRYLTAYTWFVDQKYEARNPKSETISKFKLSNNQNHLFHQKTGLISPILVHGDPTWQPVAFGIRNTILT